MQGKVVKGIGGFYFVYDGDKIIRGNARKNLRKRKDILYVGDLVEYDLRQEDKECIITAVCERKNFLSRPPVSNLDQIVIVFASTNPNPNYVIIDKLTAAAYQKNIDVVICITKPDITDQDLLQKQKDIYHRAFPVVIVNGKTGAGIEKLRALISGKNVALAGPSGAGKSTITNWLIGEDDAETGTISVKTGRGRHTTRHVEIFPLQDGTNVYDTPGFTALALSKMNPTEVRKLFPEMTDYQQECQYRDCLHLNEPNCAVRNAVENGAISRSRYLSYQLIEREAEKQWRK